MVIAVRKNTIRKKLYGVIVCVLTCFAVSACTVQENQTENDMEQMSSEGDEALLQDLSAEEDVGGIQADDLQNQDAAQTDVSKEDTAWQEEMNGKTLSILGDSISTYEGWIPGGYAEYFPMCGDLTDISQTWWDILLKHMDMELCVNGSSAGSTCVGDSLSEDNPKYGCSDYRISELCGEGAWPDIIIVYMGTNDLLTGVPIGDNDGTDMVEEGVIENFSDAYCLIIDKLQAQYPGAEIFCCTLTQIGNWGTDQPFVTFENKLGMTSEDYNKQIAIIAEAKNCYVIDLQNCGITIENMSDYITDGVHLNPEGMKLIEEVIEEALKNAQAG